MRTLITGIIVLLLSGSLVFAQENKEKTSIKSGARSVLFKFTGLDQLSLDGFDGGFGAKYYMSEQLAFRGSLQLFSGEDVLVPNDAQGKDGYQKASQMGLSLAAEFHLNSNRTSPYVGGGIKYVDTSTESQDPTSSQTATNTIWKNKTTGEVIGGENVASGGTNYTAGSEFNLFGIMGIEYFLTKGISFSAEYQLGFGNKNGKTQEQELANGNVIKTNTGSTNKLGLNNSGFLTVAVYF